jgi:F-type H+-transporting ATPase subunit epsilon
MAETLWVEVVAADRVVWEGDAVSVVARTTEGDIGILAHHEPMIAPLVPGVAEVTTADGRREIIAVEGGFLSMTLTRCAIIAPFARLAHEVSLPEAEAELRDAQRRLDEGDISDETMRHYNRASAQIKALERRS